MTLNFKASYSILSDYHYKFLSSILDIPRDEWDAIWPDPVEGYHFYLSQEQAGIEAFRFSYLVISRGVTITLIAPIVITDFNFALAFEGIIQKIIIAIQRWWPRFLIFRTLFCGSFVVEKGVIAIHPAHHNDSGLFATFDHALLAYAQEYKTGIINLKDILTTDLLLLTPLRQRGYKISPALPGMVLPIRFHDVDEYLGQLSSETRKDLRRKIKKTEALGGIHVQETNDIESYIDDIYQLYLNVRNSGETQFELLTKAFFLNFCTYMPDETIYFLYWIKENEQKRLIGFNFCLKKDDCLVDKYIGMDYAYAHNFNLYFFSFLNNVNWCISHHKPSYSLNQGGCALKTKLGAQTVPMVHMTKMTNPLINKIAILFTR